MCWCIDKEKIFFRYILIDIFLRIIFLIFWVVGIDFSRKEKIKVEIICKNISV